MESVAEKENEKEERKISRLPIFSCALICGV
jgi:hypothetical protein